MISNSLIAVSMRGSWSSIVKLLFYAIRRLLLEGCTRLIEISDPYHLYITCEIYSNRKLKVCNHQVNLFVTNEVIKNNRMACFRWLIDQVDGKQSNRIYPNNLTFLEIKIYYF